MFGPEAVKAAVVSLTVTEETTEGCSGITDPYTVEIDISNSIEENNPGTVLAYPNPADETIHITFNADRDYEGLIKITALDGKVVYSTVPKTSDRKYSLQVTTTNIPEGIYMLNIGNLMPVRLIIIH